MTRARHKYAFGVCVKSELGTFVVDKPKPKLVAEPGELRLNPQNQAIHRHSGRLSRPRNADANIRAGQNREQNASGTTRLVQDIGNRPHNHSTPVQRTRLEPGQGASLRLQD